MLTITTELPDPAATDTFAQVLAQHLEAPCVIYLHGELGAGKTSLVRAVLRARGIHGAIKSPTYTLLEPYDVAGQSWLHLDLYRLAAAEEIMMLGLRDYFNQQCVWLIEWPEHGGSLLPNPDITLHFGFSGNGRAVTAAAMTTLGQAILQEVQQFS